MKVLWTFLKVVMALVLAIPIAIIVLGTALGILGALVGIAVLALKLAVFGLIGWAAFRLITRLVGAPARGKRESTLTELPPADRPVADPHYEAALRELDRELGPVAR
jgi:hypothetical protein